ncbi:MAG TPA: cytochrome c [Gaiellaceae bacterium]|nr:cytochrome c [Gaiellaceae bacterium]
MTEASEVIGSGGSAKKARRYGGKLEVGLLLLALAALAIGAGAIGWTIGHDTSASRPAVSVKAPTTAAPAAPAVKGNAAAGKAVFVGAGCGSCHTLAATKATGTVGPNLDQVTLTPSQILDWVGKGKGAMPSFKGRLTGRQLANLAAFLAHAERSK